MNQLDIFDLMYAPLKVEKEIALIELFAGYGSQALALKYMGIPYKHHKICEWAVKSIQAYKDMHMTEDTTDYSKELTTDEIKEYLYNKGISSNYNEPMTKEQVYRLSEEKCRTIYNNIQATHNLVNIQQVGGGMLDIIDKDKYTYLLTYSFPCQDISNAGNRKGFEDTSTRSGMLWEVERILKECKELNQLPDILLMENVPLVHSMDNIQSFAKWISSLESMGYRNYYEDLIATDYGIPQTRNRTFMVSILGDYKYTFPEKIPLELKLKDLLEEDVDEKYYLDENLIEQMKHWNAYQKPLEEMESIHKKQLSPTLTTRSCATAAGMILIKNNTSLGYLEAEEGDGIDISSRMKYHRGTVQKDKAQTIMTSQVGGVVIEDDR